MDLDVAARIALGFAPSSPIACECSGEHVGMLATCAHAGYPGESYREPEHPLQERIRTIISDATRVPEPDLILGPDNCGIPTFAALMEAFATAYAMFAAPAQTTAGTEAVHAALDRLRAAMVAAPGDVAGPGEVDTDLTAVSGGAVVAKSGAEGLLCLAIPEHGVGIAIRMLDGSRRTHHVIAAVLERLGLVSASVIAAFRERQPAEMRDCLGQPVSEIRPVFHLHTV